MTLQKLGPIKKHDSSVVGALASGARCTSFDPPGRRG